MTPLATLLAEVFNFDDRAKTLESEFRYACYPDADKDELQTLLANYACHGFAAGVGVKFDRVKPITDQLLELVKAAELMNGPVAYKGSPQDNLNKALASLRKLVGEG